MNIKNTKKKYSEYIFTIVLWRKNSIWIPLFEIRMHYKTDYTTKYDEINMAIIGENNRLLKSLRFHKNLWFIIMLGMYTIYGKLHYGNRRRG